MRYKRKSQPRVHALRASCEPLRHQGHRRLRGQYVGSELSADEAGVSCRGIQHHGLAAKEVLLDRALEVLEGQDRGGHH